MEEIPAHPVIQIVKKADQTVEFKFLFLPLNFIYKSSKRQATVKHHYFENEIGFYDKRKQ